MISWSLLVVTFPPWKLFTAALRSLNYETRFVASVWPLNSRYIARRYLPKDGPSEATGKKEPVAKDAILQPRMMQFWNETYDHQEGRWIRRMPPLCALGITLI